MAFPSPTEKQARILWISVTAVAIAVFLAILALAFWGAGWIVQRLSSVLLPLAVAGILAYLLDPVVDWLETKGVPRMRAIFVVFLVGVTVLLMGAAVIVPRLVLETQDLIARGNEIYTELQDPATREKIDAWMAKSPLAIRVRQAWESEVGASVTNWLQQIVPLITGWLWQQMSKIASWMGLIVGLALVPVYLFYLLLEKQGITRSWSDYLPLKESRTKNEVVFVIRSINDYLIVFFRGQVLVALCDGILLTIGFFAMGLNYAFLLGMIAGLLSIVPFLGVALSLIPALILAAVQFNDLLHPAIVLGIFAIVQFLEGFVISPKIIGDRVGLHPLTIIIAVMVGTTLMGGIIGGILAIPLTAALRVIMFRYVWLSPEQRMRQFAAPG